MKTLEDLRIELRKLADDNLDDDGIDTAYRFMNGNGWYDVFNDNNITSLTFKDMYKEEHNMYIQEMLCCDIGVNTVELNNILEKIYGVIDYEEVHNDMIHGYLQLRCGRSHKIILELITENKNVSVYVNTCELLTEAEKEEEL